MAEPRIAVLTSGGDAPGMNAGVRAVVRQTLQLGGEAFGIGHGYEGLLEEEIFPLRVGDVGGLLDHGGTFLGTARSERMFTDAGIGLAASVLEEHQITGLVVIGGDGSFRAAEKLRLHGSRVCGVPATIDNDVGCTDTCIGFDTALNTICDAVSKIRDTASSHERRFVVEVMGRRSGMLALYSGLASGADSVLVPEVPSDMGAVCRAVLRGERRGKKHSIVMVAEGAMSGMRVAEELSKLCGEEVRAVVLGHVQRGGAPSAFDRILAARMGSAAVESLVQGEGGVMVGLRNAAIRTCPLSDGYETPKELPYDLYELTMVLAR